jgi:cytochrome d ubiquinol oxidase subunit I
MGVSAYHLLKKTDHDFFGRSFRMGAAFALVFSILTVFQGHFHGNEVASVQPAKLAAMESHWHTEKSAPMHLFSIPDEENERNSVDLIAIPGMLSLLAFNDPGAQVKGLLDFAREDRPPVAVTYWSFRVMVGLGMLFLLLAILGWRYRYDLGSSPGSHLYLRILPYVIPLPYFALWAGWTVAEVGRQPWIVYGLMRTSDAVSPALTASQVWFSLSVMTALYLFLGALDIYLLFKFARKGPAPHPTAS